MNQPGRGKNTSLAHLNLRYPALPQTFLRIMELMEQDASSDAGAVSDAIVHDPGAVGRILRLANSGRQRPEDEIRTVHKAVEVLGPETVAGVILSMNMSEIRSTLDITTTLPFLNFVRHSVATAFLARYLYLMNPEAPRDAAARLERANEAFTAGLMHDFGKLLLLYNFPEEASRFYGAMAHEFRTDYAILEAERVLFGFSHVEAGSFLARQMHFPAQLTQAMALHHTYADLGTMPRALRQLVYVVSAANRAAHAMEEESDDSDLERCFQDDIWRLLLADGALSVDSLQDLLGEFVELKPSLEEYLGAFA
ncbi:MAG: HDOD domain-containing protein [Rhodothermales bacterium]|nr:HDOD domain-containing protein [Rhodothermales bacterium]